MKTDKKMDKICVIWTFCASLIPCGLSRHLLTCPDVAQLDSDVLLMYTFPSPINFFYENPDDITVSTCINGGCVNNLGPRFNGSFVNETYSFLEIEDVKISDKGKWKCRDEVRSVIANCTLILSRTPTCHITSGNDTNSLVIHENISLSVDVTDYYCSSHIDFLLRAGNTEEFLIKQTTVKEENIISDVFNSTFNVTEKHIGSMELIFTCNNVRKTVECGGVQTLEKRPPVCNITANRDAGGLNVGEEITMSVYIEDYSCSRCLEFFLRTGGETDRLDVTGIYNETITFTVKESHFGLVYLDMNCNDVRRNLTCEGIKQLRKRRQSTTNTPRSVSGIECETRSCLLLLGVGTGVAGTLLLVGLCHLVIYLMRRKNTLCLSGNHYDGLQGRNVDARTGYDDVGIPRSQEAETAEGGEYEMTGNHYDNPQRGNDDDTTNYVQMDNTVTEGIELA